MRLNQSPGKYGSQQKRRFQNIYFWCRYGIRQNVVRFDITIKLCAAISKYIVYICVSLKYLFVYFLDISISISQIFHYLFLRYFDLYFSEQPLHALHTCLVAFHYAVVEENAKNVQIGSKV